jgi:hypothetical protein
MADRATWVDAQRGRWIRPCGGIDYRARQFLRIFSLLFRGGLILFIGLPALIALLVVATQHVALDADLWTTFAGAVVFGVIFWFFLSALERFGSITGRNDATVLVNFVAGLLSAPQS